MDEMFEALTLSQTRKIEHFPIVLCGRDYWGPLIAWFSDTLQARGCIGDRDLDLLVLLDEPNEIVETIVSHCRDQGYL
jgi:predicted Rossmann-fold nucleotide-binding protein